MSESRWSVDRVREWEGSEQELDRRVSSRVPAAETAFVVYFQKLLRWRCAATTQSRAAPGGPRAERAREGARFARRPANGANLSTSVKLAKFAADAPRREGGTVKRWPTLNPKNPTHGRNGVGCGTRKGSLVQRDPGHRRVAPARNGEDYVLGARGRGGLATGRRSREALGVSPDNARRRVGRALAAVVRIADGQDVELPCRRTTTMSRTTSDPERPDAGGPASTRRTRPRRERRSRRAPAGLCGVPGDAEEGSTPCPAARGAQPSGLAGRGVAQAGEGAVRCI